MILFRIDDMMTSSNDCQKSSRQLRRLSLGAVSGIKRGRWVPSTLLPLYRWMLELFVTGQQDGGDKVTSPHDLIDLCHDHYTTSLSNVSIDIENKLPTSKDRQKAAIN